MEAYQIHIDDIQRILFGTTPITFLLEVVFRTAVIYLILMLSMRMTGKRMSSQLSRNELAAMVSLAAAIGVPLQDASRGLLPAILISFIIVSFQRWAARKSAADQEFEAKTQGRVSVLVEDGVLKLDTMKQARISRERLFAQLRFAGLQNLGNVKRMYFEANGSFSLLEDRSYKPGLCLIPAWDYEFRENMRFDRAKRTCTACGLVADDPSWSNDNACRACGGAEWEHPVEAVYD